MKINYSKDYEHGKNVAKWLMVAALILSITSVLFLPEGSRLQLIFIVVTILMILITFFYIYTYCRCPYCGKHIMTGVLTVRQCPKCRRNLYTGTKMKH